MTKPGEAVAVSDGITMTSAFDPPGIRLGVVRGISYGLFGQPGEFVPQARALVPHQAMFARAMTWRSRWS